MPRKSIVVLLVAFSAGLLLAVSGCGGGKSSATETVTVTESTQTESTDTGSTDTESTDTESTDTTATDTTETESMETTETDTSSTDTTVTEMESTETTESTSGGSFSLANEDCQELATASASLSQAFSGGGTADWQSYVTFLNELADKAPDEIADDFRVLAEAYAKIADAMGGADMSNPGSMTPAQIAALTKLGQELDQAKLTAASQNISTWMTENCAGGAGG